MSDELKVKEIAQKIDDISMDYFAMQTTNAYNPMILYPKNQIAEWISKALQDARKEEREKLEERNKKANIHDLEHCLDADFEANCGRIKVKELREEISALKKENEKLVDAFKKIVEDEPELPGKMPDEMWELLNGNREMTEMSQQQAVKLTKKNILGKLKQALLERTRK